MKTIDPARIRSRVYIENNFTFYEVYVDNALYILYTISEGFQFSLASAELDIFTGYSRYAHAFNVRNGLPEVKSQ
jgi:hypothetical protein